MFNALQLYLKKSISIFNKKNTYSNYVKIYRVRAG